MTETIASRQNQPININRLAAQRELYSKAKYYNLKSAYLNIVVMILLSIFVMIMNSKYQSNPIDLSWLLVLASFCILMVNEFYLIPTINSTRETAAKIQELFDCDVLQIPWNHMAGDKPSAEIIKPEANKHLHNKSNQKSLEDWYGTKELLNKVPAKVGKLISQRCNITWDTILRERYLKSLKMILIAVALIPLVLGTIIGLSLQSFLIIVIATLMPAVAFLIQQYREHKNSLETLKRLESKQMGLWQKLLDTQEISETEIRQLQDEIYNHRKNGALVFDKLYEKMKKSQEDSMYYASNLSVEEFLKN